MAIADLQRFQETMDTKTNMDNPIITQGQEGSPIPVFRPQSESQMVMAPQSGQIPVAQQPRPQLPVTQPSGQMPVIQPPPESQMAMAPQQMPVGPQKEEESPLREMLLKITPLIVAKLGDDALKGSDAKKEFEIQKARNEDQTARPDPMQIALSGIQEFGVPALQNNGIKVDSTFEEDIESGGLTRMAANGGLIEMARGGDFRGRVPGDGHGMEDNVFMPIQEGPEQVGTLAVSPKEYVVDAHTMSALGNGNADKGADVMDKVVENVRHQAYGTIKQPKEINGLAALRPMTERV